MLMNVPHVLQSLEVETNALKQSLQGMLNSIRADEDALADFREASDLRLYVRIPMD